MASYPKEQSWQGAGWINSPSWRETELSAHFKLSLAQKTDAK
jgi:hypothetical protein